MTVIVNSGKVVAFAATGMNPESNPVSWPFVDSASFSHGASNEDCVAVWFFTMNWKVTVSPGCAVMFEGLYTRSAPPTTTTWFELAATVGSAEPGYDP